MTILLYHKTKPFQSKKWFYFARMAKESQNFWLDRNNWKLRNNK